MGRVKGFDSRNQFFLTVLPTKDSIRKLSVTL